MTHSSETTRSLDESDPFPAQVRPRRIVAVGLMALIGGVLAIRLADRGPRAQYHGQITARTIPLIAERDGRLGRQLVAEGDPLRIGDPVVTLSNASLSDRRKRFEEDLARLKVDLDRALAQADLDLEWRIKDVNAEIFTARLQSAELLEEKYRHEMEKVALADILTSNSTALWAPKDSVFDAIVMQDSENQQGRLSTVLRVEAASNSADVCSAQVEMCEEQVETLEALRSSLPERVRRSVGVDVVERQIQSTEDELERLSDEETEVTIVSPVIGQAGIFHRKPGDYVRVGDRIVEIFDDVQRFVVVDVPSSEVGPFKVGQEFPLTFPGDVQRRGRVSRVAPQAIASASAEETVVRVQLEPAGLLWPHVPIESRVVVSVP